MLRRPPCWRAFHARDELLRAISQQAQGEPNDPSARSKMRIYVQKEHGGELNVVISEADDDHNCCARFLLRCVNVCVGSCVGAWFAS